jgi:hypothetical protein
MEAATRPARWLLLAALAGCSSKPLAPPYRTPATATATGGITGAIDVGDERRQDPPQDLPAPTLLHVKIPRRPGVSPEAIDTKFGDPIDHLMQAKGLGQVSGGGELGEGDGPFTAVTVEVTDVQRALPVLRAKLRALGAPHKTVIEESRGVIPASVLGHKPTAIHPVW